jgi:DNA-directed RNA polymerase specialized sigma24 family protein
MLLRPMALHQPGCDRRNCAPDECVQDLEPFCGSIRAAHFGVGVKRGDGSTNGQLSLSSADAEDVLGYLIGRGWELSQRFNPVDDGRGSNRLAGFLTQRLHFACTDWTRARFGSTRYGPVPVFTPTADPELHMTETWLDAEFDDSDALDLDAAPPGTREALELLQPLIDEEVQTVRQAADRAQVGPGQVTRALQLVRAEARRQGLDPSGLADERQALADQAAELRDQGLTYKQIADELGCSAWTARALLDYHPDPVSVRAKATTHEHRSRDRQPCPTRHGASAWRSTRRLNSGTAIAGPRTPPASV